MKKINALTKEQEEYLPAFRDKWLKVGLSCEPVDKEKAEGAISKMYTLIDEKKPLFWHVDSPMMAAIYIASWSNLGSNLESNLWSNLRGNLWSNLRSNLERNLESNLWSNLGSNLRSNLRSNLGSNLRSNLGSNLWSNLGSNLWSNLRSNLRSNLSSNNYWNYFWGAQDAYWIAFYKFCNEIDVQYSDKDKHILDLWGDVAESCMWWWAYEGVCFVCDRPQEIHKLQDGRLHNDSDMAVRFRDGWGIYAIEGRDAPEWLVTTPADEIAMDQWVNEENVTIRLQIEQKVGQEKVLEWLDSLDLTIVDERTLTVPTSVEVGADYNGESWEFAGKQYGIVDTEHRYELVRMTFPNGDERRALRMRHATTGEQIPPEWVPPETSTVQEALAFRNGTDVLPSIIA